MLNFILILETFLCLALNLAVWLILFNIPKINNALSELDLKVDNFRKQVPEIQLALRQLSLGHFIQELIFSPASFLIVFEAVSLAQKKALTRQALLKLLFKR